MNATTQPRLLDYRDRLSVGNKVARVIWNCVWAVAFRPTPVCCFGWRRWLLRRFGARIAPRARPYPGCRIWAPWNLNMAPYSCLADHVRCYCVAPVTLGERATVSQHGHLCAAGHDITDPHMTLTAAPIVIGAGAWVCADAFVGAGVTLGEGAVAGARAVVVDDVPPWTVVAGNPARPVKQRELR